MIFIDPWLDFGYDKQVTVTIAQAAYKDLYGISSAGPSDIVTDPLTSGSYPIVTDYPGAEVSFKFKTASATFSKLAKHNASQAFPPRAEALSHFIPSSGKLMLYGGRGSNGECFDDLWTSFGGTTWTEVVTVGATPGKLAGATISSVDKNGCVWVLGGQCDGALSRRLQQFDTLRTSHLWKSCDTGSSWSIVPIPSVHKTLPTQEWPKSFTGHSLVIVGGWQILVVDAPNVVVWKFTTADATEVEEVSRTVPWQTRRSPYLMVTSSAEVYLTGGHNCASYSAPCVRSDVFMDIWSSTDIGATWNCMTAIYGDGIGGQETYTKGMYKAAAAMTYDDTMWLLGGRKPNSTTGFQTVYTSYNGPRDVSVSATPYLTVISPKSDGKALPKSQIQIFFAEDVKKNTGTVSIKFEKNNGGTWGNAGASIDVTRQVITVKPSTMSSGGTYRVKIPTGALTDLAGNTMPAFTDYQFEVHSDNNKPTVSTSIPAHGQSFVSPKTNIVLIMSEVVTPGTGSVSLSCAAGIEKTVDISQAFVRGPNAFFPVNEHLTEGQEYTVSVPDGLFVDERGLNSAAKSFKFTVISGSSSSATDLYRGTALGFFNISNISNATLDVLSDPVFIHAYPKEGATDVTTANDTAMVLRFSKQVVWNKTGVVSILNSSGKVVAQLNRTREPEAFIDDVINGTRVVIGASSALKTGASFTVSVPAGLVVDLHGVLYNSAISTSFTCLAGYADEQLPVLAASSPYISESGVLGSTSEISMYFSKALERATTNNILIKRGSADAHVISSDNTSTVLISGSKLTVKFSPLLTSGPYGIEIPARTFKDSLGNFFMGINQSQFTFSAINKDTTPPTLSGKNPAHEGASPTYTLPAGSSMLLSFSEGVQAGVGSINLVPRNLVGTISVGVTSSDVVFSDELVAITPPTLISGEAYDVTIDAGAFKDLEGNEFVGLTSGNYLFSTAPLIRFKLVGNTFWVDNSVGYFDGPRYQPNVIIDTSNNVYVAGGYNGSAYHSHDSVLSDVWKFATKRHINTHNHHEPYSCSQTSCNSPTKRGTWSSPLKVWKAPSNAGLRAVVDNWPRSSLDNVVSTASADCPCPMCLFPPEGRLTADPDKYAQPNPTTIPVNITLPTQMVNTSYTAAYTMVSAALETRPLLCRKGYHPSGDFICGVNASDPWSGEWQQPYPYCIPDDCPFTPPERPNQHHTSRAVCNMYDASNKMLHDGECSFKCDPGYKSDFNMKCSHGTYQGFDFEPDGVIDTKLPTCNVQYCDAIPAQDNANIQCTDDTNPFETLCKLLCSPGHYYDNTGATTVGLPGTAELGDAGDISRCFVIPDEPPETAPRYHQFGTCKPRICGDLNPGLLAGGSAPGSIVQESYTSKSLGGLVNVTCPYGYEPVDGSTLQFICAAESQFPAAPVLWKGSFACTKRRCPPSTDIQHGVFSCTPGDNLYLDVCQLTCNAGYTLNGGNGTFTCDGSSFKGTNGGYCNVTKCSEPPQVENAVSSNCTGMVDHNAVCAASCSDGFEARGAFKCSFGVYITEPVCIPSALPGQKVITKYVPYVTSSLDLVLAVPPGSSVADIAADPVFREKMLEIIAVNLPSAAILGITQSDVFILSIILVPDTRRLKEAQERLLLAKARRLQETGTVRIDYKVRLRDEASVYQLTDELVMKQKLFKQQIKGEVETIDGLNITVLDINVGKSQKLEGYEVDIKEEEDSAGEEDDNTVAIIAGSAGGALALVGLAVGFVLYKRHLNAKTQEYIVK
jgi:hypothetical protein